MKGGLGQSFRASTGPLYTQRQLAEVEAILAGQGYGRTKDEPQIGARLYFRNDEALATVVIHLDELGCHPNWSGMMMLYGLEHENKTRIAAVWSYAKEERAKAIGNPVLRFLYKHFTP